MFLGDDEGTLHSARRTRGGRLGVAGVALVPPTAMDAAVEQLVQRLEPAGEDEASLDEAERTAVELQLAEAEVQRDNATP